MGSSGSSGTEGWRGLLCGILFGLSSPLVGHPIDSVKTRMQASSAYYRGGALRTLVGVVRSEGFLALYRGLLPPLLGSSLFRSVQISVYASAYTAAGASPRLCAEVPGTGGLQARVLLAAVASSTARALIECPMELIKVRQQTGQPWLLPRTAGASSSGLVRAAAEIRNLYTGFGPTWARTVGLMGTFFILVDSLERLAPQAVSIPLIGPFLKGGVCATLGWVVVWPLENLRTQIQARAPGVPENAGVFERARHVLRERGGVPGLFRGMGPGLTRSMLANGTSMIVYDQCQKAFRRGDDTPAPLVRL